MARKKQDLPQLTPWEYNPTTLQGLELRDLKALYTAKRSIMVKRLKRLEQSEFTNVKALQKYSEGVPTIKQLTVISEGDKGFLKNILARDLADLNLELENRYSKLSELRQIRDKSIETLHEHGITWVNKSNYESFVDFQNYLKQTHLDRIYDSATGELIGSDEESEEDNLQALYNQYIELGGTLPIEVFMKGKVK